MTGYCSPYVPGWDTHGLPTELKALKKIGLDKDKATPVEIRRHCREFAMSYVDIQRTEFKRLGVTRRFCGSLYHPEARVRGCAGAGLRRDGEEGADLSGNEAGLLCSECGTALAEAEIEYNDDPCETVFVKFKVADDKGVLAKAGIDLSKAYFVIWTTTVWTLPGNLAICLGPDIEYTAVKANGEYYIMAKELADGVMKTAGIRRVRICRLLLRQRVGTSDGTAPVSGSGFSGHRRRPCHAGRRYRLRSHRSCFWCGGL